MDGEEVEPHTGGGGGDGLALGLEAESAGALLVGAHSNVSHGPGREEYTESGCG
jgi:hypothetical protein